MSKKSKTGKRKPRRIEVATSSIIDLVAGIRLVAECTPGPETWNALEMLNIQLLDEIETVRAQLADIGDTFPSRPVLAEYLATSLDVATIVANTINAANTPEGFASWPNVTEDLEDIFEDDKEDVDSA